MLQVLLNVIFSESMLNVICFLVVFPVLAQLVNFTSNIPLILQVEGLDCKYGDKNFSISKMILY
jgi:hypothetical protein